MRSIFKMKLSPRNIICLDTEFTNLQAPELLSLGLASGSGAKHYAELDLQHPDSSAALSRCSDFVRHCGVLKQWGVVPGSAGTYRQMAQRTFDWLTVEARAIQARTGQPAYIAFDYLPDFKLLASLLQYGGLWWQLKPLVQPLNAGELTSRFDAVLATEAAFELLGRRGLARHHALADALALRAALHAAITGKQIAL